MAEAGGSEIMVSQSLGQLSTIASTIVNLVAQQEEKNQQILDGLDMSRTQLGASFDPATMKDILIDYNS